MPNLQHIKMKPCGLGERAAICSFMFLAFYGRCSFEKFCFFTSVFCDLNPKSFRLLWIQNSGPSIHCIHFWSTMLRLYVQPRFQKPQNILSSKTGIYAC